MNESMVSVHRQARYKPIPDRALPTTPHTLVSAEEETYSLVQRSARPAGFGTQGDASDSNPGDYSMNLPFASPYGSSRDWNPAE